MVSPSLDKAIQKWVSENVIGRETEIGRDRETQSERVGAASVSMCVCVCVGGGGGERSGALKSC